MVRTSGNPPEGGLDEGDAAASTQGRPRRPPPSLLLFGALLALMAAFWIHRVHVERPDAYAFMGNGDLVNFFYPSFVFMHDELRAGRLPAWNPYQMAGEPFLAGHAAGALYPPNLLLLALFPAERALGLHAIFHFTVAAFFTWLFCARLGMGTFACATAAFLYAFAPQQVMLIYQVAFLSSVVWLPAVFWALQGLLSVPRTRWAVALALAVAMAFLGGHAQGSLFIVEAAAVYAVFGLWRVTPPGQRLRTVGLGLAAALLCLGFIAPQLLPTVELARESVRGFESLPFEKAARGSVFPWRMGCGLLGGLSAGHWPTLGVFVAALGPFHSRLRAHALVFMGLALLCGLYMMGPSTPVFRFAYELPLGSIFRQPTRISFVYVFFAALLIAAGVDFIQRTLERRPRWLAIVPALLLLFFAGEAYRGTKLVYSHPASRSPTTGPPELMRKLAERHDHGRVFLDINIFVEPKIQLKAGMMNRFFALPDYEPALPSAYEAYFQSNREMWHGGLSVLHKSSEHEPRVLRRLLDIMGVRTYLVGRFGIFEGLLAAGLANFTESPAESGAFHFEAERNEALARTYTVGCVRLAEDRAQAITLLQDSALDPTTEAIVEAPTDATGLISELVAGCANARASPGPARIERYDPHEVQITASCGATCLLVLSDLHYPGWRTWVDGTEQTVLPTNGIFRGVPLAAGRHDVRFVYRSRALRAGIGLCGLAALVALGWLALERRF